MAQFESQYYIGTIFDYSLSTAEKPCKVLSDSISDAGDGAVGIGLCNEFEIESSVNFSLIGRTTTNDSFVYTALAVFSGIQMAKPF